MKDSQKSMRSVLLDVVGGGKRSETAWVCERVGSAGLPDGRVSYDN